MLSVACSSCSESSSKPHGNRGHPAGDEMYALVERESARLGLGKEKVLELGHRLVAENAVETESVEEVVGESHTMPTDDAGVAEESRDDDTLGPWTGSGKTAVPMPKWRPQTRGVGAG